MPKRLTEVPPKRARHTRGRSPLVTSPARKGPPPMLEDIPPHILNMMSPMFSTPADEIRRLRPTVERLINDERFWDSLLTIAERAAEARNAQQDFIQHAFTIFSEAR